MELTIGQIDIIKTCIRFTREEIEKNRFSKNKKQAINDLIWIEEIIYKHKSIILK
jgi:hypothetical protein